MILRRVSWLLVLLNSLIIALFPFASTASDLSQLQQLQAQGRVFVAAHLNVDKEVAVEQQVVVTIELLTDTWFTQGTRIHRFEVDNALVLQRNSFATNSVERIGGKTYTKQSWEVVVYPLESGKYAIPSIVIDLSVKGDNGNISGQLTTSPLLFTANKPDATLALLPSFVGDEPRLEQTWKIVRASKNDPQQEASLDDSTPLQVGDAIERTMMLTVNNSSATLLPQLIADRSDDKQLITYNESPQFKDEQDRGQYSATRTEKVVYVVKEAGTVVFPEQRYAQWSVAKQAVLTHEIALKTFEVKHTARSYLMAHKRIFVGVVIAIGVGVFAFYWCRNKYLSLQSRDAFPLWWLYLLAIKNKDDVMCEFLLYRKQFRKNRNVRIGDELLTVYIWKQWQIKRYYDCNASSIKMNQFKWLKIWASY